jgi:hypothetical protein
MSSPSAARLRADQRCIHLPGLDAGWSPYIARIMKRRGRGSRPNGECCVHGCFKQGRFAAILQNSNEL